MRSSPTRRPKGEVSGIDIDLEAFFEENVRSGAEHKSVLHRANLFADAPKTLTRYLLHEDALQELQHEGLPGRLEKTWHQDVLVGSLAWAVQAFAEVGLNPMYRRVIKLEADFAALRTEFRCHVAEMEAQRSWQERSAAIQDLIPVIRKHCADAFGAEPTIVVRSSTDREKPVVVLLDLSHADKARTSEARSQGARRRFYEALLEHTPGDVFEALDFEFVFP